jgi:hypothetical protein
MLRRARTGLLVGAIFLTACITTAQWVVAQGFGVWGNLIREGLVILGWVAMWRPIDMLLYDWWPLMDNLEIYGRLSRIPVEVLYNT